MATPAKFFLANAERSVDKIPHLILPALESGCHQSFLDRRSIQSQPVQIPRAKNKLTGRNFVAEALSDLTDAKRKLHTSRVENICEIRGKFHVPSHPQVYRHLFPLPQTPMEDWNIILNAFGGKDIISIRFFTWYFSIKASIPGNPDLPQRIFHPVDFFPAMLRSNDQPDSVC
jgi:hypothetical protein